MDEEGSGYGSGYGSGCGPGYELGYGRGHIGCAHTGDVGWIIRGRGLLTLWWSAGATPIASKMREKGIASMWLRCIGAVMADWDMGWEKD